MKKIGLIFCVIIMTFLSITAYSQIKENIIYLKNGDIFKGKIVKEVPGDYINLELKDASIKKILISDILKREENYNYKEDNVKFGKDEKSTSFGIKGGLSYATALGKNVDDETEFTSGMVIGGFVNFPINTTFAIQTELLYAQHGYEATYNNNYYSDKYTDKLKIDLISIPILLNIGIPLSETIKFDVNPGLGVSFNIKSEIETNYFGSGGTTIDCLNLMNKVLLFSTLGIGLEAKMSNDIGLLFDLRINSSSTGLIKDVEDVDDFSIYFMVGLHF